ncbi:DUF6318 family protein [Oryzihumus leptocrescens]|nr:DUF6318 family protein [Oryzihumus leptocrescens]
MGNRTTWRWAVTLSALVLTTGCGGQAKPEASSSRPVPTAGTMTTASSPATSPTPAIDPDMPAAARAHTPAGAEAFARYFFAQFNASLQQAKPDLLGGLASDACKSCQAFIDTAVEYRTNGQHYSGEPFTVATVGAIDQQGNDETRVLVSGVQHPGAVVDASGKIVQQTKYQKGQFSVHLKWINGAWVAEELKVVK